VISAVGGWTAADEQELSGGGNERSSSSSSSITGGHGGVGSGGERAHGPRCGPESRAALTLELARALAARQRPWPVRARTLSGAPREPEPALEVELDREARAEGDSRVAASGAGEGCGEEAEASVPWARKRVALPRRHGSPKPCLVSSAPPALPPPASLPLSKGAAPRGSGSPRSAPRASGGAAGAQRPLLADLMRASLAAASSSGNSGVPISAASGSLDDS
jgi:hypothetical protein